jgi:hypothetical protein
LIPEWNTGLSSREKRPHIYKIGIERGVEKYAIVEISWTRRKESTMK